MNTITFPSCRKRTVIDLDGLWDFAFSADVDYDHPDSSSLDFSEKISVPGAFFRDCPGEKDWRDEASRRRFIGYYRSELRELLTGYGKIDEYRKSGRKIPKEWIKNPFYLKYYKDKGWLE